MPHHFLIRWLAEGRTEWVATSSQGAVLQGPQPGLPSGEADRVVLILPAESVLLLESPRVARSAAQLAKALPFAIEEQIAAPIETQHVAFAETASDALAVAVVERSRLGHCVQSLAAAGLRVDAAYSELQCLPRAPESRATLALIEGRALIRWGRHGGIALPAEQLDTLAPWLARVGVDLDQALRYADLPGAGEALGGAALSWLARHVPGADVPNLMQGEFAPARRQAAAASQWRWAAALAALAFGLGLLQPWLEARALQRHVEQRQAEMEQLLRQALPGLQRVVDPVAQLRAAMGGSASTGDALALLGRIAPIINSGNQLTIEGIEYRAGSLELVVMGADVASLDSLRERLSTLPALQVELTAATPGSRGVEGRLRLREAGA